MKNLDSRDIELEIQRRVSLEVESYKQKQQHELESYAANEGVRLLMDDGSGYQLAAVLVEKIDYNPLSIRDQTSFEPDNPALLELIEDIKARGGLVRLPLVYRNDDRYILVKGHRRVAALRAMGESVTRAYILPGKPPVSMEEQWVNGY